MTTTTATAITIQTHVSMTSLPCWRLGTRKPSPEFARQTCGRLLAGGNAGFGRIALALVRKRNGRILGVDLARQAVAVEDGLGDEPWRDAVPDPEDRLDPLRAESVLVRLQLEVEALVREALRHQHDRVRVDLLRLHELVVRRYVFGLNRRQERAEPLPHSHFVEMLADRTFERLVADRRYALEGRDDLDAEPSPASFSAIPAPV